MTASTFALKEVLDGGFPWFPNASNGTFYLVIDNVRDEAVQTAVWGARVVRTPKTIVPGLAVITGPGERQIVGIQDELLPTLDQIFGWSLAQIRIR